MTDARPRSRVRETLAILFLLNAVILLKRPWA